MSLLNSDLSLISVFSFKEKKLIFQEKVDAIKEKIASKKSQVVDKSHELIDRWEEKSRDFIGNFLELFGRDGRIVRTWSGMILFLLVLVSQILALFLALQ